MNVGEYGISFNLNVNYDLSGFTTLSLAFTRPDGTVFTTANGPVTVPSTPLATTDQGTFAANQYAKYSFAAGDLTKPGIYTVRLTYADATKRLISDIASFSVSP